MRGFCDKFTHEGLFTLIGRQGALCGNVNYVNGRFWASEHAVVVSPKCGIITKWLGELLRAMNLNQYSVSAAQPGLSVEVISNLRVPLPKQEEQHTIAAFLDRETAKIDALVAEQENLIALLKEKQQAVISHAVTKGLDPTVPMKDSGIEWLGEVPDESSIKPFKAAVDYQEGPGIMAVDFHEEGVPLLRVSSVQSRWASIEGCNYLDPDKVACQWKHFRLVKGDLLISASASMGVVSEVTEITAGCIPYTGLIRLRPRAGLLLRDYLRYFVVSALFLYQIERLKTGATIQHFGPTHLSQMVIICPTIKVQQTIVDYLDTETAKLDDLTTEAQHTIDLLKERRSALISAAVTGKIDVRGYHVHSQPIT